MSATRTPLVTRPLPVLIVLRSAPTNRTASAKPMEKVNSPASVDGMLPPHIEFASMNRKQSVLSAPSAGPGNGTRSSRRQR
jgi:hypothetical protein